MAATRFSSLITSNDADGRINPAYPQDLQPRDRTRPASQRQINDIAARIDPTLLAENPSSADGAPIVGPDNVVESGNGRTLALAKAYRDGNAEGYQNYLRENGYADQLAGVENPVLVRVRTTPMTPEERRASTLESNERTSMALSATERAMADAGAMPDSLLPLYRGGDIDAAGNRDFFLGFMQSVVADADANSMMDKDKVITQEGVRRVQGALLAKAYGDADLVAALIESTDNNIKAIGGAMPMCQAFGRRCGARRPKARSVPTWIRPLRLWKR